MGKPRVTSRSVDKSLLNVPQFCCDVKGCNKYFSKLSRLKYHQNIHLEEKPYKCDYEGCTSSYYRPNHLKRHIESVHKKKCSDALQTFICSEEGCGASFESESSLYYHKKRKHSVQPLKCSFCDKRFSKKWMLKEHEAGHTGISPFTCEIESCGESFKAFSSFKAHKRDHMKKTNVKCYTCPLEGCNLSFPKWSELVLHKKSQHADSECDVCQKIFTKGTLKIHQKIHEEDRSAFQCPVDGCPRFYFHQKNLTSHMRIKHEGVAFQCTICNRKLSSKQKLDQHVEVMHKNKTTRFTKKSNRKSILSKLGTMTESDWSINRSGPSRFVRLKYNCLKFRAGSENNEELKRMIADKRKLPASSSPLSTC